MSVLSLKKRKTLDISEVSLSASVTSHNLNIQHINDSLASTFVKVKANKNEMVWIKIKLSNPFTILQIVYYYIFYGNDNVSGVTACVDSKEKYYDCIKQDNNTVIDIKLNDQLVTSCGQLSLTLSVEQEDQVYILNCGVVGDEVYLSQYRSSDNTKPRRIVISDIAVIGFGKNIIM